MTATATALAIDDLVVDYGSRRAPERVIDGVSLCVEAGSVLGLIGESGSGKSTIAKTVFGMAPVTSGSVALGDTELTALSRRERRALADRAQLVFQDPYSSFNPVRTVGSTLGEPLEGLGRRTGDEVERVLDLVKMPADAASRRPHAFSGGQRQRLAIARALIVQPELVVLDEPVSALDVSVQAQVVNLLMSIQRELELSMLFIAHDLAVVRHLSQRIVVLYRGRVMEDGTADDVVSRPAHPYTRSLIDAVPVIDPHIQRARAERRRDLASTSSTAPPVGVAGCSFVHRCPFAIERCSVERPPLLDHGEGRRVACHRADDLPAPDPSAFTASSAHASVPRPPTTQHSRTQHTTTQKP